MKSAHPIAPEPLWLWRGRVPCLDGLRGVAILLVVFHHSLVSRVEATYLAADLGVDIFFVISGFLITLLLLREFKRTGTLSLTGFYRRRALRILPAYIAFLLMIFALTRLESVQLTGRHWFALLTYTVNFIPVPWDVSHVWSLSIEEHYYLLWPLLLMLLGPRWGLVLVVVTIVLSPAVRVIVLQYCANLLDVTKATPARLDCIAVGCLLAFLAISTSPGRGKWLTGSRSLLLALACLGFLAGSLAAEWAQVPYYVLLYHTVNALALGGLLWLAVHHPASRAGRALTWAPLARIGVLSYSLYLWHKLFINPTSDLWIYNWPWNLALMAAAAALSYFLIEAPFLRLKDRPAAQA
jgi:peptidoglycan/LPS O-acetylase OafA/YrhL